jgi:DNA polymerase I-like protein with 3'-5' exonuclease and polymerase domains
MLKTLQYEGLEELEEGGGLLLPAPLVHPRIITTRDDLAEVTEFYSGVDAFAFDVETRAPTKEGRLNPFINEVFWIGLATTGRSDAIPMGHPNGRMLRRSRKVKVLPPKAERRTLQNGQESKAKVNRTLPDEFAPPPSQLRPSVVFDALRPLFFSDQMKVGQNLKFDVKTVAKYVDGIMPGPFGETMVTAHLLDERRRSVDLEGLARDLLGITDYPKLGKIGVEKFSIHASARYVCQDAGFTWTIHEGKQGELQLQRLDRVWNMEMDLFEALVRMEMTGALVDEGALQILRDELHAKLEELEAKIYVFNGGRAFNINSNLDKIKFLFSPKRQGGRGLKPLTFTPTTKEPQVNDAVLQHYADRDPAVALLVEYGDVKKLSGTYADSWYHRMHEGRLHPDFVQFGARTGRLSCREPNMQNVPRADTELGRKVRDLIVAPPGYQLVVADYDQIELRVIAHFSRDPTMVETFESGADIHGATAELLLGLPRGSLKKGDVRRQLGKNINFATSFGAGPAKIAAMCLGSGFPLGNEDRSAIEEAEYFLDQFDRRFAAVAKLKRDIVATAKSRKPPYVKTIMGRIRRLPELWWEDKKARSGAERQAVNTVIQGSAADIMKLAMIRLDRALLDTPSSIIITVHDELVIEAPDDWVDKTQELVMEAMGGITLRGEPILSVPLTVACGVADRWSDAK